MGKMAKILFSWKSGIWLTVLGAIVAVGWYWYAQSTLEVTVAVARKGDLVVTVTPTETGTVDTDATALVKAEASGRVLHLNVHEGETVKAAAVLATLDAEELQARVRGADAALVTARARLEAARVTQQLESARARAALDEAQARHADAQQRRDKKAGLYAQRLIPRSEMESSDAELAQAAAAVAGARAGLAVAETHGKQITAAQAEVAAQQAQQHIARLALERSVIRAPFAGQVMELPIKVGEWLAPGTPVARITRPEQLYVRALIDEVDLSKLRNGQAARVQFDTVPDKSFAATVFEIAPSVTVERLKSRSIGVKVRLQGPLPFLRPGLSADVEIIVDTVRDALLVPAQVVMSAGTTQFVYVLAAGRLVKRNVTTGRSNWEHTEIVRGLQAGERVVTSLDDEGIAENVRARERAPPKE